MNREEHWNRISGTKSADEMSWFETVPETSLRLLQAAGMIEESCVVDVGCGDSRLIDHLIARGLKCLAALDASREALARMRARLGVAASIPVWIEADVTGDWSVKPMDIWHDRAVFHFLTDVRDRDRYRSLLKTVKPGGSGILATFAFAAHDAVAHDPVNPCSRSAL